MTRTSLSSFSSSARHTPSTSPGSARTPSPNDGSRVARSGSSVGQLGFECLALTSTTTPTSAVTVTDPLPRAFNFNFYPTSNTEIVGTPNSSSTASHVPILTPWTTNTSSLSTGSLVNAQNTPSGSPRGSSLAMFQFYGAGDAIPSIEDRPSQLSSSQTPSFSFTPPSTTPGLARRASTSPGNEPTAREPRTTPREKSTSPPLAAGDRIGTITSHLGNLQIADKSVTTPIGIPTRMASGSPPQFLDPAHELGSGSSSRLSPGRRRRSSSQNRSQPHNVSDEEPPEDRFHHRKFQRAFNDARDIMGRLERTLSSSSLHLEPDSTMRRLRDKAGELARFYCPPKRTVGFVGDSGVGKSSLLNSLLDHKDLARSSNSGAACTCVVTEYRFHAEDSFAVEVDLFSTEELERQLTEMVQAYRRHHMHPPSKDREEREDIENRANVAYDTFEAMFRGPDRLLGGAFVTRQSEANVIQTMVQWATDLGPSDVHGRTDLPSKEACSEFLIGITSEPAGPTNPAPSIWPFIKKIRVFLNAHILSKGLVLVDLPGLRDLNSARQNITERYILECDEIFAVCCIGRAVTDVGVKTVFDLARQARLSNVGIVCTKSDDIRANEAMTDWKGTRARAIQERIETVNRAKTELTTIETDLAELANLAAEDELTEHERNERTRLFERADAKRRAIQTHEFELQRYLVTTRNEIVERQLFEKYRDTIPGGALKVFCASNTLYWDHRFQPRDRALPFLELSRIMALRKHCVAMVANSQLRIATNYMDNDIRSLVSSVELWVRSGAGTETVERKTMVRETLDVIENRLKRDLSGNGSPYTRLARTFAREFQQRIYATRRVQQWTRGAEHASDEWSGWHHSTYSAFCRNYGNYSTRAAGSHNWNEEAMAQMVRDMGRTWAAFHQFLTEEQTTGLTAVIEQITDWTVEYLDNQLGENDVAADILRQAIESRQGIIVAAVEDACQEFMRALRTLRADVFSGHRTSMMGKSMEDAYRGCNAESGTGSDSRRKGIISRTLSNPSFFEDFMRAFQTQFKESAVMLETKVLTAVDRHLAGISEMMNILRDENVIAESERDEDFRRRVEVEVERVRANLRGLEMGGRQGQK